MAKHHVIISGTGRAGTTFLVQLLTQLGLDTGFSDPQERIDPQSNAGMEHDLRNPDTPYIVKSPWMCDYLDEVLSKGDTIIDHAIIPMRNLFSAAESRRVISKAMGNDAPGAMWHTDNPSEQEDVLTRQLYALMYTLARHDIPITLLEFPKLALDPMYVYKHLSFLEGMPDQETFLQAFTATSAPEKIHSFVQS